MYLDILITSEKKRNELIAKIQGDGNELRMGSTTLRCEKVILDELVSLETEDVEESEIQGEVKAWLAPFQPKAVVSGLGASSGYINLVDDQDVETWEVLAVMAAACPRVRHRLAILEGSDGEPLESGGDLVSYLKQHEVDPHEVFRGVPHVDVCIDSEIEPAVKYFVDDGRVDPDHWNSMLTAILFFEEDGPSYLKKRIEQGEDPKRLEDGVSLLHILAWSIRAPEITRQLLELGLDPNQQTDDGQSVLLAAVRSIFEDEDWDGDLEDHEEDLEYLKLLRSHGARADLLDSEGEGVLSHVQASESLTQWFCEHFPELKNE